MSGSTDPNKNTFIKHPGTYMQRLLGISIGDKLERVDTLFANPLGSRGQVEKWSCEDSVAAG